MLSKPDIKWIRSLHHKKFREQEGCFIVEGPRLLNELLSSGNFVVRKVYALPGWVMPATFRDLSVQVIDESTLSKLSALESPNKVLAVVEIPGREKSTLPVPPVGDGVHLLLDQIQDPGNLGTIIRIADWFGLSGIYCSLNTVELFNPKVIQSTMGSVFRVPVMYTSLADLLIKNASGLKRPVYATTLQGENIFQADVKTNALLIMGNEGRGIDPLLIPFVTGELYIPGKNGKSEGAESLNVAVAAGIVCAEFARRKLIRP